MPVVQSRYREGTTDTAGQTFIITYPQTWFYSMLFFLILSIVLAWLLYKAKSQKVSFNFI